MNRTDIYYYVEKPSTSSGYTAMERELGTFAGIKYDHTIISSSRLHFIVDELESRQLGNQLNHKTWKPVKIEILDHGIDCTYLRIGNYLMRCHHVSNIYV